MKNKPLLCQHLAAPLKDAVANRDTATIAITVMMAAISAMLDHEGPALLWAVRHVHVWRFAARQS